MSSFSVRLSCSACCKESEAFREFPRTASFVRVRVPACSTGDEARLSASVAVVPVTGFQMLPLQQQARRLAWRAPCPVLGRKPHQGARLLPALPPRPSRMQGSRQRPAVVRSRYVVVSPCVVFLAARLRLYVCLHVIHRTGAYVFIHVLSLSIDPLGPSGIGGTQCFVRPRASLVLAVQSSLTPARIVQPGDPHASAACRRRKSIAPSECACQRIYLNVSACIYTWMYVCMDACMHVLHTKCQGLNTEACKVSRCGSLCLLAYQLDKVNGQSGNGSESSSVLMARRSRARVCLPVQYRIMMRNRLRGPRDRGTRLQARNQRIEMVGVGVSQRSSHGCRQAEFSFV